MNQSILLLFVHLSHQVVEVAEDVDAEEGGAHSQDVEVELVVGQDATVPVVHF